MKALVTGASGFIGSTLIEQLSAQGHEVFALMRKSSSLSNLTNAKFQRIEGDLSDFNSLQTAVKGMDVIFHLAGATAAPTREAYFEANANGTERLARAVKEANPALKRFVYVSSLAAGGPASSLKNPRTEADPAEPVSFYGESKLQGEVELLAYKNDFPIIIVRPPMVYGPRDRGVFVIIRTVSKNLMPIVNGATPDGNKYYSLIHCDDLCRGIVQAGLAPSEQIPTGEMFYMTGDGYFSYRELLSVMAKTMGKKPVTLKVPAFFVRALANGLSTLGAMVGRSFPLNRDKLNEIIPDFWICSNEKAKTHLGFQPEFDLDKGMANTIDWYKRKRWI